jgi:N-methylhydantoinase A
VEAAAGVHRLVNLNMADGIRLMTLRRGVDPRRFALLSFGGAAGLHAVEVARELEMRRVIVPLAASVLSAWGMLTSDLRYEVSHTHFQTGARSSASEIRALFADLEAQATERLRNWFEGSLQIERAAEMRYGEQVFEIDVSLADVDWDSADLIAEIEERFHRRHEELYTYCSRDQEVVFVNARVAAVGALPRIETELASLGAARSATATGSRQIFLGDWQNVPLYRFERLTPGERIAGPALVEAETTTVLLNEGDRLVVNELGWLDISLRESGN